MPPRERGEKARGRGTCSAGVPDWSKSCQADAGRVIEAHNEDLKGPASVSLI